MNPYQFPVTCSICGGDGVGTIRTAGAAHYGEIRHIDPGVCASYLREKAKLLKEREAKILKAAQS